MVFVYTGVFSENNVIIHYNSVKKHRYRLFADGDLSMFQLASMLPMFDVRCVHRPNSIVRYFLVDY